LFQVHPISPGHNEGAGNYVLNPEDPGFNGVVRVLFFHFIRRYTEKLLPSRDCAIYTRNMSMSRSLRFTQIPLASCGRLLRRICQFSILLR
jgi:hypothetical protein